METLLNEIQFQIEDMGISILSQTDYDFEYGLIMSFRIPSPFKSKEENYNNSIPDLTIKISFTNEIMEVIERVKDYCHSVGYYMDISINGSKFNFDLLKKITNNPQVPFTVQLEKRITINITKR